MLSFRRVFATILSVAMLASFVPMTVSADTDPTIAVSEERAYAGETADVSIDISNNPGITAMQLNVDYNNEYLTLTSVTNGEIFDDNAVQYDTGHLSEKPYVLTWGADIAEENIISNGTLVTLTFEVSDSAPIGNLPITVTYDNNDAAIYDANFNLIDFALKDGGITVEARDFDLTFEDTTVTYDGTEKGIELVGTLPEGADVTYEPQASYTAAGEYDIKVTVAAQGYNTFEKTAKLTISKAALTVKANNVSKYVGADDPTLTYTYEGTLYGADAFSGALTREEGNNIGSYAILQGTLTAGDNYEIAYEGATFTINAISVTGISLDKTEATITVGGTETLVETVLPENATDKTVNWSSSDETVATVAGGVVTAVSAGTATITATTVDGEFAATCAVTVVNKQFEGITLADESFTYDGTEKSLAVSGAPAGATVNYSGNGQTNAGEYVVTVTVSAPDYDTVQKTAKLTIAKAALTVKADSASKEVGADDPTLTYTYEGTLYGTDAFSGALTREEGDDVGSYAILQGTLTAGDNYEIAYESATFTIFNNTPPTISVTGVTVAERIDLVEGDTYSLIATVLPENATNKAVIWSSDDESVATVDQNGVVTAVAESKAHIIVKTVDGEFTATCAVYVSKPAIEVTDINLNKTATTITVGATETLTATVLPENATDKTVTWSSTDELIATVDENGVVTAVSAGTVEIWARTNKTGVEAWCLVTVTQPSINVPVTGIGLDKTAISLVEDDEEQITATVEPENATNKTVFWSSDNPNVAAVDENGKVTAISAGTATITAVAGVDAAQAVSGYTATCEVTVTSKYKYVEGITLSQGVLNIEKGDSAVLTATVTPDNASNPQFTWSSDNPSIATVVGGVVTAVSAGTATITVTTEEGGFTAKCTVKVAEKTAGISGYVKDSSGNGVSYAQVTLSGDLYSGSVYTSYYGYYSFYDVPVGDYTITAQKSRYVDATESIVSTDFANTANLRKTINLASVMPSTAVVTVMVKDTDGNPVKDAYIDGYMYDSGSYAYQYTDEDGKAIVELTYYGADDSGYVYVYTNGYYYYEYRDITASPAISIEFTVPAPITITGKVMRGETPLSDVSVQIKDTNYYYYYYDYATTDENGRFEFKFYDSYIDKDSIIVAIDENSGYTGSAKPVFAGNTADVTIAARGNIKVKGSIKNRAGDAVSGFRSLYFYSVDDYSYYGNYITTITCDENGNFESLPSFGAGKYRIEAYQDWPYTYKEINKTFVITEAELEADAPKELTLVAEEIDVQAMFNSDKNTVTASMDTVSRGDKVTVNVKFHNDGNINLSNVQAYAIIPAGLSIVPGGTNGTLSGNRVSRTVALKPNAQGNLFFTIDTSNYNEKSIVIAGYVVANGRTYTIGSVNIEVVSVTLSAPQIVKTGEAFTVSGEAVPDSVVEILNYKTREVLARKTLVSRWYYADLNGIKEATTFVAKVTTKDGRIAYSEPVEVKVQELPISVNDIEISWSLSDYGKDPHYGYPIFSIWEGYSFIVKVKFDNIPPAATVRYSFAGVTINATKGYDGYYSGTFGYHTWGGYGTKKVIATVTTSDGDYEFIVGEALILVDPSGIITDSETGEPIEGVKVTLEVKNGNNWELVDPAVIHSDNPMYTNAEGHYGWNVPEGTYRIIAEKTGYVTKTVERYNSVQTGDNSEITVLPARFDVNFTMTKDTAVQLDTAKSQAISGGRMKFVLTRSVSNVTSDTFKISNGEGDINGTLTLSENNTVVLFTPNADMPEGNYTLTINGVKDADNNVINDTFAVTKGAETAALAVSSVALNDGNIEITFDAEPAYIGGITVKNGTEEVAGTLVKNTNVITFVPDSILAGGTYTVTVPNTVRTSDNKYVENEVIETVTVSTGHSGSSSSGGISQTATVKLDTNGGDELKNIIVSKGQSIGTIETPTKKGYVFTGWYADEALTKEYSADDKISESTTLYAGWAVDPVRQITLTIDVKDATVFGEEVINDVAPVIRNDRTMLPIRFIAEALGAVVDWDGENRVVTITGEGIVITIGIGQSIATVNGEEILLDSPAFIESDRTFIPLRFVSENLGAEVEWIGDTRQVVITKAIEE